MTAKDLLYKILEYDLNWKSLKDSEPAQVRLVQIEHLLGVFGLSKKYVNTEVKITYRMFDIFKRGVSKQKNEQTREQYLNDMSNLTYFFSGEFLYDRPKEANQQLENIIKDFISLEYSSLPDYLKQKDVNIKWLFADLMSFRREIYKITQAWGGMLEGFVAGLHYSHYLQHNLKTIIGENLEEIDNTLWLVLDPQKRDFKPEEINYTEYDLDKIDWDWKAKDMDNW